MPTIKKDGYGITCDKLVKSLIDRLFATEQRIVKLTAEVSSLQEQLAEQTAWLVPGTGLRFKGVLEAGTEKHDTFTVIIPLEACKVEAE